MAEKTTNPVGGDGSNPSQSAAYPPPYSPPITSPPAPGVMAGPAGYGHGWGGMQHNASNTSTTVVVNQTVRQNVGPRIWNSGVCSCFDDMGTCCLGTFCPCILACQIAGDMGESLCVPCCVPGWLIVLRTKLRAENNIMGTVLDDCCTICCCGMCVMCQLKRELKHIRATNRAAQQGTEMPQTTVVQSSQNQNMHMAAL